MPTRFLPMSWMSPLTVPITDLALRRAGFSQQRTQEYHAALHGVGGQKHLGNKQDAVTEIDADDTHAFDKRFGQNAVRLPPALQQDVDAFAISSARPS